MIKKLSIDDKDYIKELEGLFPEIFSIQSISNDLENNPYSRYLIYLEDDKIIGYINYYLIYERGEIVNFNILSNYQNLGIGTKLLKEVIKECKNLSNISLEVREDNCNAIHLYEKYGFRTVSTRKNYYNDGVDGLLMVKEINNKDVYILGIESSCDETSFSIVKNGTEEIATVISTQIDIHKDYGGVVPEIASREHVKNVSFVIEECLEKACMRMEDIDAIAIANGPGLIGSLLVGLEAGKTLSWLYNKPLVPVHHIAGHIYANNLVKRMEFPLMCLVISGGHTELVYMKEDYSFEKLGGTLDDAVGECYDKVGKCVNLEYPAGPKIDKAAKLGQPSYKLPMPLNDDSYNFSFSGLKSAVINLCHNEEQRGESVNVNDLCCSFQKIVESTLVKKTMKAMEDYDCKNLILAGGVSANTGIRDAFKEACEKRKINYTFPDLKYCTDNAAMVAAAGYYAYKIGRRADLTLNAQSTMELK